MSEDVCLTGKGIIRNAASPRRHRVQEPTLPKYLSSSSTYLWMISSVMSSLSWSSMAQQKYRLAYLQHDNRSQVYVDNGTKCFYVVKSATSTRLMSRERG